MSFATVYWIDVFTRELYFDILKNSFALCREEKGMELFAYCFMPSHVHFIFRSKFESPSSLMRDIKGFTSRALIKSIKENPQESRREWLLFMMKQAGKKSSNVKNYQFWQQHNKPIELWSSSVIQQKIDYVHNNPVVSGFVIDACDWKYSSARNYAGDQTLLKIDI